MLFNKYSSLIFVMFSLIIIGCSENTTNISNNQQPISSTIESPCGERYYELYINRTSLAGLIRVANDLDNLYITYSLDGDYLAEPGEMHVWLGPGAPSKRGTPKQYTFHSTNSEYLNTYSFTFLLSDIQQYMNGSTFYFMTFVSVVTPDGNGYSSASDGFSIDIVKTKSKGAWFGFNSYTLMDCGAQ